MAAHAEPVEVVFCNQKVLCRRAFVHERQGAPYIAHFRIRRCFNAVSGVASRRSAPDTEILSQEQYCSLCGGCSGEKWITSPLNCSLRRGEVRALTRSGRRRRPKRKRLESKGRRAKPKSERAR